MNPICLLLLILPITANIWDNIFSQLQAPTPILIQSSFNFDLPLPSYATNANVDYNVLLNLMTLSFASKVLNFKLEFLRVQVDLSHMLVAIFPLEKQCQTYEVIKSADNPEPVLPAATNPGKTVQRLSLLNLLFLYRGPAPKSGNSLLQFKPQVIGSARGKMEGPQGTARLRIMVEVNSSGGLQKIKSGEDYEIELQVHNFSGVKRKTPCSGEVIQITEAELREKIISALEQNNSN